jgi:putative FmdB family regulatory protein
LPIYTYQCQACGTALERRQSFSDAPLTTCEACGGALRKMLHPVGIVFKGSGFYNTDYRGNGATKTPESAKADGSDGATATPATPKNGSSDSAGGPTSSSTSTKPEASAAGAKAE